jgi:hypothetical protein
MANVALLPTKTGANAAAAQADTVATNPFRAVLLRGVSEPLYASGNSGGTMQIMIARVESNAAMNANSLLTVYATVGNSDTVRGTLFSTAVDATEWPTVNTGGGYTVSLSTVALQAGDRIVVEYGYNAANSVTTSYTGTVRYGGTVAADLVAGTTGVTTRSPWVEFSAMDALFTAPKPLTESLVDDFEADNRATKWPDSYGATAVSGGVATVTAVGATDYVGLQTTAGKYSIIESYAKVRMTPAAGIYSAMTITPVPAAGDDMSLLWIGGTLTLGIRTAYTHSAQAGSVALAAGTPIYMGVGEGVAGAAKFGGTGTAGNLYFYTSTDGSSWTLQRTVATPAYAGALTVLLEAGEGSATATFDDFNVDVGPAGFSGTLNLSGSRTLVPSGSPTVASAVGLAGSRTLTLSGSPAFAGSLTLSRTGSLTPAGSPSIPAALAMSGTGQINTVGIPTHSGTILLSISRSLSLSGTPNFSSPLNLAGTGGVAGTGTPTTTSTLGISGSRTFTFSGLPAMSGLLNISGSRALTLDGSGFALGAGSLNLSGSGSVNFAGAPSLAEILALSGSRTLTFAATLALPGTLTLTRSRTITLTGAAKPSAVLNLSGSGALTLSGSPSWAGALGLSGTGTTGPGGSAAVPGSFSLAGSRTLSLAAQALAVANSLGLTGTGALALTGVASAEGSGSLNLGLTRTLTLTGSPRIAGTLARAGAGALALAGAPQAAGTMLLEQTGILAIDGVPAYVGTLDLSASGEFTIDGTPLFEGTLIITAQSTVEMFGSEIGPGGYGGAWLKDGTQLQPFMLVGGILVPIIPHFKES